MIVLILIVLLFTWVSIRRMCMPPPAHSSRSNTAPPERRVPVSDDILHVFRASIDHVPDDAFGEYPIAISSVDKWHIMHHIVPVVLDRMRRLTTRLEFIVTHLDGYRVYEDEHGSKDYRIAFVMYEKVKNMSVKVYVRAIEKDNAIVIAELHPWNDHAYF